MEKNIREKNIVSVNKVFVGNFQYRLLVIVKSSGTQEPNIY